MVTKAAGGRPAENVLKSEQVSIAALAKLKIHGLSSRNTIQRYHDAWDLTGLPEPRPSATA